MSDQQVVIVSAVRTPIGSFLGSLSSLNSYDLGAIVIKEALARAKVEPGEVSEVIMGQVLQTGQGQNPARHAAFKAGLPESVPAYIVNMICGSGLKSIMLGAQAIKNGDSTIVVCGGMESMSKAPHSIYLRNSNKFGNGNLEDTILADGLTDAMYKISMGETAENMSVKFNISREKQDECAFESQKRATDAQKNKLFSEEMVGVPITSKNGTKIIDQDEFIKPETTLEILKKLRPAFIKDGTVTPGNASGLNDGAAAVVLMSESTALSRGLKPMGRIVSYSMAGIDPKIMGFGPVPAIQTALKKANWSKDDVDLYEINEAFGVVAVSINQELGLDPEKVNINGGAIALGHPLGASGTRVTVTLLHALKQQNKRRGVASLCIGGGMGVAMCIERF